MIFRGGNNTRIRVMRILHIGILCWTLKLPWVNGRYKACHVLYVYSFRCCGICLRRLWLNTNIKSILHVLIPVVKFIFLNLVSITLCFEHLVPIQYFFLIRFVLTVRFSCLLWCPLVLNGGSSTRVDTLVEVLFTCKELWLESPEATGAQTVDYFHFPGIRKKKLSMKTWRSNFGI